MEKKRKKKKKKNFQVLVITNNPKDKVKKIRFTRARVNFIRSLMTILLLVILGYGGFSTYRNTLSISRETGLDHQVASLKEDNDKLQKENAELSDKVNILSETVNQKVDAEKELEEKNIPSGFPLSGTADLEETNEVISVDNEEVTRPIIIFKAGSGTSVVASGGGTVALVDVDATYGNQVLIDHGNGYISIYRSSTDAKVKAGDEVTRGTLLFELGSTDEDANEEEDSNANKMGYQIIKDGTYIDPTDILVING